MSHNHNSLALIEHIQVLHDTSLIVGIERVGRLVKEDIVWILIHRPCNQDTLFLSLAQTYAITSNLGIEFQRQSHYVILDASYLGSFQQPFLIYIAIIKLVKGLDCRFNLIRFHQIPDIPLQGVDDEKMEQFRDYLTQHGVFTTIRASRGQDIYAACGLLSTSKKIGEIREHEDEEKMNK